MDSSSSPSFRCSYSLTVTSRNGSCDVTFAFCSFTVAGNRLIILAVIQVLLFADMTSRNGSCDVTFAFCSFTVAGNRLIILAVIQVLLFAYSNVTERIL